MVGAIAPTANSTSLFEYTDLGSGSEIRAEIVTNSSIDLVSANELKCGEEKCGESKGDAKKDDSKASETKSQNAHLYGLLPIPFRQDAVRHIVSRIKEVQGFLERPLVIENVSYYTPVAAEIKEEEFISAIVVESGCKLLLDVNNVYVNAFNHSYNTKDFVSALPLDSVAYVHMAGHAQFSDDCIIDTHGGDIIDPVFDLFEWTLEQIKPVPVLLERDFNIPELKTLNKEIEQLRGIISKVREKSVHHA